MYCYKLITWRLIRSCGLTSTLTSKIRATNKFTHITEDVIHQQTKKITDHLMEWKNIVNNK